MGGEVEAKEITMNKLPDKASEGLTEEKEFHPTPHMLVWLDTAIQLESDNTSEISETCKISRTAWYDWLKDPEFVEWFNAEWDRRIKGHAWKLDVIGMKNSKRDFNYWKAMQQRVGRLEDKPSALQQFNIGNDMGIEFVGEDETSKTP